MSLWGLLGGIIGGCGCVGDACGYLRWGFVRVLAWVVLHGVGVADLLMQLWVACGGVCGVIGVDSDWYAALDVVGG